MDPEGHRLLFLKKDSVSKRFVLRYISKPKGEAYVYKPYFIELASEIFIVVEEGYEFMSGIDLYRLKGDRIDFLGYVPVAGDERNTIINKMKLEKSASKYKISFKGQVEYKAGTDNLIDGSRLFVRIDDDGLKIELDNKVQ